MSLHYHYHLTIGFAGKRVHKNLDKSEEPLKELFKVFDKKLGANSIRLISGLADGADLKAMGIFCNLFSIESRQPANRVMGTVLPFGAADFKKTLELDGSKNSFDRFYPLCDQKLELDGKFVDEKSPEADAWRNEAYQQQGKILSKVCDVLVALTPYDAEIKVGGTVGTIFHALYLQRPVIHYDLKDEKFYLYQSIEDWLPNKRSEKSGTPEQLIDSLFKNMTGSRGFEPVKRLHIGRMFVLRKIAWLVYERYLRRKRSSPTTPDNRFRTLFALLLKKRKYLNVELHLDYPMTFSECVYQKQKQFEIPAQHYQTQYRGGYFLNYMLALLAIVLAVISIVIKLETPQYEWVLALIGIFKLAVISLLLYNTYLLNENHYNKRAIDYRYAIERLRVNSFMSKLGIARAPKPSLGNHSKKHFTRYKGEEMYQKFIAEPLLCPFHLVITKELLREITPSLRKEWLSGQIKYHKDEAGLMDRMDDLLERVPRVLSYSILAIVVIDLLAVGVIKSISLTTEVIVDIIVPIFMGLTALLPAIVTMINSIRFQSDAHRLANRSVAMVQELKRLRAKMTKVIGSLKRDVDAHCQFQKVIEIMDEAACLFTDEVAEWSLIYEHRVYDPG